MSLWFPFAILILLTLCSKQKADAEKREFCKEAEDQGLCRALVPRWHYNFHSGTCRLFIYGGCGGNKNNFKSRNDCLKACKENR